MTVAPTFAERALWAEQCIGRRLWAAMILARDFDTLESVLRGRPVLVANLYGDVLAHALRGTIVPPASGYFRVRVGHLDAVCEAEAAIVAAARTPGRKGR